MRILIAPNAFKHSLGAREAAEAIRVGLAASKLKCMTELFPVADGGDGTVALIIEKFNGQLIPALVHDPLGRTISSSFGLIRRGKTAVIEMADASGLRLLKEEERNPLHASSYGTGELISQALDLGVEEILLAMGGSATVDAGVGILRALGIRFLDHQGSEIIHAGDMVSLHAFDQSGLDQRILNVQIKILCDVDSRLLGPEGAAAVFGPQKGADEAAVLRLEAGLQQFSQLVLQFLGKDLSLLTYAGAAGGASAGVHAFLNARLLNGIEAFIELTGFDSSLQKSDLLITGEGSIDLQTLHGKGPLGLALRARAYKIPVIAFAGRVPLSQEKEFEKYFDALIPIGNEAAELQIALAHTRDNLIRSSILLGNLLQQGIKFSGVS